MSPAIAAIVAFFGYILAYRIYARFLSQRVFRLDATVKTLVSFAALSGLGAPNLGHQGHAFQEHP